MTRSKVKVTSLQCSESRQFFKSYLLHHLQWELTTDRGFLNWGTISKFVQARFLMFGLVFVSHDFEVGTNVSCEESTFSPVWD